MFKKIFNWIKGIKTKEKINGIYAMWKNKLYRVQMKETDLNGENVNCSIKTIDITNKLVKYLDTSVRRGLTALNNSNCSCLEVGVEGNRQLCCVSHFGATFHDSDKDRYKRFAEMLNKLFSECTIIGKMQNPFALPLGNGKSLLLFYPFIKEFPKGAEGTVTDTKKHFFDVGSSPLEFVEGEQNV